MYILNIQPQLPPPLPQQFNGFVCWFSNPTPWVCINSGSFLINKINKDYVSLLLIAHNMTKKEVNFDKLAVLSKLLKRKRGKKWVANRMGLTIKEVETLTAQYKKYQREEKAEAIKKEDLLKGTLESVKTLTFEPKDHKELALIHNIDLKVFQITNYWSKLQPNGNFTSSVFCKRKTAKDYSIEDFKKFLDKYESKFVPGNPVEHLENKTVVDVELSISDYHLAKKYVDEKGANVKQRADKFFTIAESLVKRTHAFYNINEIVFPISNDFFHTDTYWNTTTNGTAQDVIAEYDEEYEVGFDLLVKTIIFLKKYARKVKVVLVPGNHDKTKGFFLAHGLEVFFREDKSISFLRNKDNDKYVVLGNTFIGYHHGNCKIEQLPLLFATNPNSSVAFGEAKFREVHTGDKHHYMAKEIKGVRIHQMPSLSGADRWHKEKQFVNQVRAALLLMYDKEKGKVGEIEERIIL